MFCTCQLTIDNDLRLRLVNFRCHFTRHTNMWDAIFIIDVGHWNKAKVAIEVL